MFFSVLEISANLLEATLDSKAGLLFLGSWGRTGRPFEFLMKYLSLLDGFVCYRWLPTLSTAFCSLVSSLSCCCGNHSKAKTYILANIIFGANKIFHFSFQHFVRSLQFFFGLQSFFKCSGQRQSLCFLFSGFGFCPVPFICVFWRDAFLFG